VDVPRDALPFGRGGLPPGRAVEGGLGAPPTVPAISSSTMPLNVLRGSACRSIRSAAETTAPPANPAHGPPATAQASTAAAAQHSGSVPAPWSMRAVVSTSRVASTSAAVTATSAPATEARRVAGRAYATVTSADHAAITASAARPPDGWAYRWWSRTMMTAA
jgi:hypothetical protein